MAKKYFESDLGSSLLKATSEELKHSLDSKDDKTSLDYLNQIIVCTIEMHQDCENATHYYQQETGHYVYVSP